MALVVSSALAATSIWTLTPMAAAAEESEREAPAARVEVGPLPSSAGERELEPAEGDWSGQPSPGDWDRPARDESAFDPATSELDEAATTATRAIYDNGDGTQTAVLSPGPVRYQEGGEWQEIDLGLAEEGGEIVPEASPAAVAFPTDPADGVAVHDSSAGPITVGVPSVVARPEDGAIDQGGERRPDQVVVEGASGVESVVTPLATGFEHDVVFASREAATDAFTVALEVPNGVIAEADATGVALRDGDEVVAHYGAGVAFDAGATQGEGDDVAVATALVGQAGTTVTVRVSVDPAWLADPARQFPVTVDPTYTSTIGVTPGGGDTYVSASNPTTSMASAVDLRVGRDGSGNVYRSFLRFGLGGIPANAVIYDAEVRVVNFYSTSCAASLVRARTATSGFDTSTTWNTQPGSGGVVSDSYPTMGATGCPGGWTSMDATSAVAGWYADPATNFGLRLTADEATSAGYRRFYSSSFGSGYSPKLVVTYDRFPPVPTRVAPADGVRLATTTPTLSVAPVTDPDGETVTYTFRVWAGDGLPVAGHVVRSPGITSTSWTVPEGLLADGVTYAWTGVARGGGGWFTEATTSSTFTVDRRLSGGPAPSETVGPVTVNLATGDAGFSAASPGMATAGGGIAPAYTYHSTDRPPTGLTGSYYVDANANALFDDGSPTLVRTDRSLLFEWTQATPFDGLADEQYLVRWTGFVTVPTTDTYYFGAAGGSGYKVSVNGTTVVDRWPSAWALSPMYGTGIALTAGQTVPITVDLANPAGSPAWMWLAYKNSTVTDADVPTSWLTPSRRIAEELSPGWELDLGGSAPVWERALATDDAITAYGPDGSTLEFDRTPGGGFVAADSDAVAALDTAGLVTIQDGRTTYAFGADGTLTSATDGVVDDSAAPLYTWTTTTTGGVTYRRVSSITDPVSNRSVNLTWRLSGATCPTAPSGFDTNPPTGALCKVAYWDGTTTSYAYKAAQLARIVDPGGATTDLGYTGGVLTSVREPLAHDAIAAGVRADDTTALTQITHTSGRATKVTLPAPTPGASRPETTFTYGAGTTSLAVAGNVNGSGYTRRVAYDASARQTGDTDIDGRTAVTVWSPTVDSELWSTTEPIGLTTTYVYDGEGSLTDTYGPAPSAWFGSDRRPLATRVADVPHRGARFDEGVHGLGGRWFPNATLSGAPKTSDLVGDATGRIALSWPSSPTGTAAYSGRFTGSLTFGAAGTYALALAKNARGRVYLDGKLVVNGWASDGNATGSVTTTTAGEVRQIVVELVRPTAGTGALTLKWTPPSSSEVIVPGSALTPDFGNLTTMVADGSVQTSAYAGSGGNGVADGAPSSTTVDPAGAALVTQYTYEPDGTGWQRKLTRTLPAGNVWTYSYYGGTETRDNPCTTASDPAVQGGDLKVQSGPTAADGTARAEEFVYDSSGLIVASRIGSSGGWTCMSYDSRSRMVEEVTPAFGGAPARTVTHDLAVGGSPLVSSVTDPAGTITTEIDLLGRVVATTDVWGTEVTTTYDRAGRETAVTTDAGGATWTVGSSYNPDGSVDEMELDGDALVTVAYDVNGRLSTATLPAGGGGAGNGTSLAPVTYDALSRPTSSTWRAATGTPMTTETVAYDVSGRVVDQVIDGADATPSGSSYVYDGAGRLVTAVTADRVAATGVATGTTTTRQYDFAATGGCGALAPAGRNSNRTALRVNGSTTASYCYDAADRLTSTTQAGYTGAITYDAHGNVTAIAGEGRAYDGADRHRQTTDGTTTVTYVRDALDRIVERVVDGVPVARYAYAGSGDSPVATLDPTGAIVDRVVDVFPGVALLDDGFGGSRSWSYPNIHGDAAVVADTAGAKVGPTRTYDAFGEPTTTLVDPATGDFDWGWLGRYRRPLEHEAGLVPTVEMGARQYDPALGRFLAVDPIVDGNANDYVYPSDPINNMDLDGKTIWFGPSQYGCGISFPGGNRVYKRASSGHTKLGHKGRLSCTVNVKKMRLNIRVIRKKGWAWVEDMGGKAETRYNARSITHTSVEARCAGGTHTYWGLIGAEAWGYNGGLSAKVITTQHVRITC